MVPSAVYSQELTNLGMKETWCGAGTNGKAFAAAVKKRESVSDSEVTKFYVDELAIIPGVDSITVVLGHEGSEEAEQVEVDFFSLPGELFFFM